MSDVAIRVEGLSKMYRIGARQERHDTLRDAIVDGVSRLRVGRSKADNLQPSTLQSSGRDTDFWALKDVSFEVKRGEVMGVIGRNGAGKSTLLKILSRITEPTEGRAEIHGRVGSLLEVGTGFHPELTGRDNIYLNGAILGMRRTEIAAKFDEIVAFSEIEQFLDTPVKRYSSGMYVRLAFAVAAHLEPEILLVDEVLAVGDAQFQKKCLGKMGDVAKEGRTVLFVSHNMTAVQSLCETAIWLEQSEVHASGTASWTIAEYLAQHHQQTMEMEWKNPTTAPGNEHVRLKSIRLLGPDGEATTRLTVTTPLRLELEYWNLAGKMVQSISIHLSDLKDSCIFSARSDRFMASNSIMQCVCRVPGNLLNDGTYKITLAICRDFSSWLCSFDDIIVFEIHDVERPGGWLGKWPGAVRPSLEWSISLTDSMPSQDGESPDSR